MPFDTFLGIWGQANSQQQQGANNGAGAVGQGQTGVFGIQAAQLAMNDPVHREQIIPVNYAPQMRLGYSTAPVRRENVDAVSAVKKLANNWVAEGLDIKEIVVSKETMVKLQSRMGYSSLHTRSDSVLSISTAMGVIKFTCEDDKPSFDLGKYMETVE